MQSGNRYGAPRPFQPHGCNAKFRALSGRKSPHKNPVFHVSLNPAITDCLTDAQLTEIAREYMERMGFGDQPYYVFKHRDIDREHIHIVSVRIDEYGRKLDHNFERRRSVDALQSIERRYGLRPAVKGQEQREFDTARRVEYGRDNLKQQMKSAVRLLAEQYRFGSISEFRTLLNLYNVDLEERKGEADGKRWNGIVYTATDEQGKWVGTPIKSSALTPKGGYKFLQKQIARNDADIKSEQIKGPIRGTVARAMHRARTQDEFVRLLKADGIDAVFRQNAAGRITGATFVDHRTKTVLNGSRLGKSYSANVFQELFNNPRADRASLLPKLSAPAPAPATLRQQTPQKPEAQRPETTARACRAARSSGGGTASEARPDTSAADGEDPHGTARIIPAAAPGAACTPRHRRKPVPCRGRPAGTDHRGRSHVAGGVRSHAPQPFAQAKATA